MIPIDLRTRIFLRALGLLSALILAVTFVSGVSSVTHQRDYARTIYQGQVRTLTLQMAELVLLDDRVALYKLITDVVEKDQMLGYGFLEREGRPYVYTFQSGIPTGLLSLGPYSSDQATVTPFKDQLGGQWLDIAQSVSDHGVVLHLGVNVDVLFWQAIRNLRGVLATSLAALLVGIAFAWKIAVATTREVLAREQAEEIVRHGRDELSQMNDQLVERTKNLEQANNGLESFSYSVAHDLRGPLRAIHGYAHILLEDYYEKLDDEGRRLLNAMADNAGRMGRLIEDLLQFSRTSRSEMAVATIDMTSFVAEVFNEVHSTAADRNIVLHLGDLPSVRADKTLLHQVLTNLIANAVKFTARCAEAVIDVQGKVDGAEVVYRIQDNGVGFDMQYADKLFGVFERLHSPNEFEGTGIGLAIVKRVVERHGGRVWAEAKVGEGATFYFTLPAVKN